jgi:alpha-amylase
MRRWQTPPEGGTAYDPGFGTYGDLVGYADIQYNSARTAAAVVVNAASRTGDALAYSFNGGSATTSNVLQINTSLSSSLSISISTSSGKTLDLDPINFIWQIAPLTAAQSTFQTGQKGGIVELFGWPWVDIGKECAFLGKAGYMGVKIWPPNEHVWGSNYVSDSRELPSQLLC